tara:strand:+ start:8423 stop:8719 length:297 start_codon:yes stop_codon:yes gene_type:complete
MTRETLTWLAALPAFFLAFSAQAHDPAEHMKGGEKPDCAAMQHMDRSRLDSDDAVMQAMMQKCMDEMHRDQAGPEDSPADHSRQNDNGDANSPAKHEQ